MASLKIDLLTTLQGMGLTLTAEDSNLLVGPKAALTEEARDLIRAHKADLLEALQNEEVASDLREHFNERAGILEFDGGLPRPEAELEAARITATYARNCGHQWASLRAAFEGYPELLAALPDPAGPVDALPLGAVKVAVLSGKRVVRQGSFTGAHEVKAPITDHRSP